MVFPLTRPVPAPPPGWQEWMAPPNGGAAAPSLAPLESLFEPEYSPTLREIATVLYLELMAGEHPPPAPDAASKALAQTQRLADMFGGQAIYIPNGYAVKARVMARRIVAGFTGFNHDALARQFRVSSMRVRQILLENDKAKRKAAGGS